MSALKELVSRSDAAEEKRSKAVKELDKLRAALKQESGEDRDLTPEEETRSDELISVLDEADKELDELDKRVKEETKREKRAKRISEARDTIKSADAGGGAAVKDEPMVYGEGSPNSYIADLCRRSWMNNTGSDGGATDRLIQWSHQVEREFAQRSDFGKKAELQLRETDRELGVSAVQKRMRDYEERGRTALEDKPHEMEVRTGIATGGGATGSASGGGGAAFVTPVFFVSQYAPYREYGRAFIDQCNAQPLPDYGMEVYMPAVEGPAEVKAQTEAEAVAEKVPTAGYLSGALKTEAGQVIVSQQLLDRAGPNFAFDKLIFDQLERDYAPRVDKYVLTEALAGALTQPWAGSSESFVLLEKEAAGGLYGQIAKAKAAIRTTEGTVLNPTHLFLAATRWEQIAAWADGNARPLVVPGYAGPFNAAAGGSAQGDEGIEGSTGYRLVGLPVFADQNIPAFGTIGADQVIVGDLAEVYVYEGNKVPRVIPQTYAQNLQTLLQLYAYITCIVRYPKGIVAIHGPALKTPVYTH
ncbi:MAG: hypothetical protein JWM85_1830 [Acidimicrobiaceae bacterium]|nr:hypothetical protein [Acidimicrobiaceae bacterium]